MDFVKNFETRHCGIPVSAGAAINNNSDIIDMTGYQSATFIAPIDDSVATGVATLAIEQNDTNQDGGMTALSGALATATCAVNDDLNSKLLVVEVRRPTKRYIQAVRTSATANIAYGDMVVILNGPRTKPVPEGETIAALALASEPDES